MSKAHKTILVATIPTNMKDQLDNMSDVLGMSRSALVRIALSNLMTGWSDDTDTDTQTSTRGRLRRRYTITVDQP